MEKFKNITASQAFDVLKNEKNSYLIDVRTLPEWNFCGVPDLSSIGKEVILLSWMFYPRMELNNEFCDQVEKILPDKNSKIFFLCKVGGRSTDAAINMSERGYNNCYNIMSGFEGDKDEMGCRARVNGWKAENLPWYQN